MEAVAEAKVERDEAQQRREEDARRQRMEAVQVNIPGWMAPSAAPTASEAMSPRVTRGNSASRDQNRALSPTSI